jgi:hypothetical protein
LQTKAYTNWLSWFDDNCLDYYIKEPTIEKIREIRGDEKKIPEAVTAVPEVTINALPEVPVAALLEEPLALTGLA